MAAPASTAEAVDMVLDGLGHLAALDPATLTAEAQARCLQGLEQCGAISTAARARILAAFTAGHRPTAAPARPRTLGRPLVITKSTLVIVQLLDRLDIARSHHLGPGDHGAVHVRQDRGDRLSAGVQPVPIRALRAVHMAMIGQPGFAVVAGNWRADEHSV